ncbi:MAG: hypothetical protein IPN33_00895 [Saprospiraceae bacterium]|nr:hypothetical protein [Saprospiraceae bacterium]
MQIAPNAIRPGLSNTPTDCVACHQSDYDAALNPNHAGAHFSTDCASCHTTDIGWMPATFTQHDADYFPIYSGEHEGEWDQCVDCHTDPSNFAVFSCTVCHQNPETNEEHDDVNGYIYESSACLACHPTGSAEGVFDHNSTHFPLTGAHTSVNCLQCHASGYAGTPTDCASCHTDQYNQTDNPSHTALGLSTDCAVCHTTAPGWMPATFANHNDYYALNGAHAMIANECATCHNGDYNNTPNTCAGCHTDDYNNTNNPNHVALNFSTDCTDCHGENTWVPSTFDHDSQHFPIYSGEHEGEWDQCTDCHTNTSNYAEFTCITCHSNPDTDEEHDGVGGYSYNSPACLACHPTGDANLIFDHNTTNFPLTGAHITAACIECHSDGYQGTPTNCVDCHTDKYNQTHNPNHAAVGISTDCAMCHTTGPWWSPATFPNHNDYHALNGAHATIADNCAACHHGDYNNTPTTCAGCHTDEFNLTSNPDHQVNQFPTDCTTCHTENSWAPSTFDHNVHYPFTGAHMAIANDCVACHNGDYANTPNTCAGCHTDDFNNSVNPNHTALGLPTDCDMCHTTAPDWAPATFPIHNNYYTLNGAHAAIANDCATCHNGDYTNTPNTCFGCHSADYNTTASPNHAAAQFSTNCTDCHGENAWVPSTFDHDAQYFPIYSGQHEGEWNQCTDCHTNPSNYAEFTCITCHTNPETNNDHNGVGGYTYNSTACLACHPNGDADLIFNHNTTNFPLTGEHATAECLQCHATGFIGTSTNCIDCHTDQFNQAANPNHVALGFSMDCASCHTTQQGWSPAALANHNDYYALNGGHGAIANDCVACHNGDYNNTPNTCNGCHTDNYNQTTNPNHAAAQFPTDCASCHTESAWAPSTFNHDAYYSLTGAHVAIADDCAACHHGDYSNTPTTCAGCHTDQFNQAANPNHVALGFSDDCASCHTTAPGWSPATFASHNDFYALNGAHGAIANDCTACHNGDYTNTPNTCNGCHAADYNQTSDPNHATAQFPTDCALCHTESAWAPATFDHDAIYPFTGAHVAIADDCAACHHGDYSNTPNTCAGCHTDQFNQAANPNHVALGFSDDCASCHTTAPGWSPATFASHNDFYALNGAHGAIANDCTACHNGNYNNTPNTCNGCHAADYNQTSDPNHATAQFPRIVPCAIQKAPGRRPPSTTTRYIRSPGRTWPSPTTARPATTAITAIRRILVQGATLRIITRVQIPTTWRWACLQIATCATAPSPAGRRPPLPYTTIITP